MNENHKVCRLVWFRCDRLADVESGLWICADIFNIVGCLEITSDLWSKRRKVALSKVCDNGCRRNPSARPKFLAKKCTELDSHS